MQSIDTNALNIGKNYVESRGVLLPKNLGITDQQRLKMVNSQDALLLLKYIHVQTAIK